MNVDKKIIERLEELIKAGEKIEPLRIRSTPNAVSFGTPVDGQESSQWGVSCLNVLTRIFGKDSDHYQKFNSLFPELHDWTSVRNGVGIMRAAKDDYENGYLFDVRVLIQAEVFDDFLEQAQHLFDAGFYAPAAVVAGSVLEDGLRKLCVRNRVSLPAKPKLDTMNADLAKAGVYNLLVQKQITALADLRNNAAHGRWTEFTDKDVGQMLIQVRAFMTTHFS